MPDIWLVGNIKPIYKNKGNPFDPKNFRPITRSVSKFSCCTRSSSGALFRFLKNLNKSPKEMLGCFLSLPLFNSFQYSNKACGEDYVVNEYIKSTSDLFLPTYEKIFNAIFNSGVKPDIWLVGNIKPIYKNALY
jgi:hypothetical protein